MNKKIVTSLLLIAMIFFATEFISCKKNDPGTITSNNNSTNSTDSCTAKVIVITATPTGVTPCGSNGSIVVSATGSTGFSFKLDSTGAYQTSGAFSNVNAGSYIVYAKDVAGCVRSTSVAVAAGGAAGPLFTNVKSLISAKCESCHNINLQNGGMNFDVDCNIVTNSSIINTEAVVLGAMPLTGGPLSQIEKNTITTWINAGGGFTN